MYYLYDIHVRKYVRCDSKGFSGCAVCENWPAKIRIQLYTYTLILSGEASPTI